MLKILTASPTAKYKDYCLKDYIINVRNFTCPTDLFLIDNSDDTNYHKKILSYDVDCVYYNNGKSIKEKIAACQNIIREKVISEKYDYLLMLETDIFPPVNMLELLLSYNKDVISLPYFTGEGFNSHLLMSKLVKSEKFITFEKIKPEEQLKYITGDITNKIRNNGIGCMLIKRKALEKIKFRTTEDDVYSDTHFHIDLFRQGFENYIYTGTILEHRNSNWDVILDTETLNR